MPDASVKPSTPNPASTVVLARRGPDDGIEIFLNRRPDGMETYAGAYVFPGGRVETDDASAKRLAFVRGLSAAEAQHRLGADADPHLCLAHWVAAARELFEETGIHFFVRQGDGGPWLARAETDRARLAHKRRALQQGATTFDAVLESERVYCDLSGLIYFFHRVTPVHYRIRFDTRFYLTCLPQGQKPLDTSEEVAASLWTSPQEALDRRGRGELLMMPPTVAVLQVLADYRSWPSLCAGFRIASVR